MAGHDHPRRPQGGGAPGSAHAEVAALLRAAADGDQAAWNRLVERFTDLLWAIGRSYRLNPADTADVVQMTWLKLLDHVDSIQDPARLPGWLATTCRRECQALLRQARRVQPIADERFWAQHSGSAERADAPVLVADRDAGLWRAYERLSGRCRQVLRVLVVEAVDRPSYAAAAAVLEMPTGSLGPTRARCLEHLRKELALEGISGLAADS